ncbi:TonB family protein [Stenotrophomonas bentonitica]|uniref:TonB family protein n=1 Tax=Stenotrophomonas bentonitica TaxID=1450134 RepID=UPI0037CF9CFE
MTRFHRHHYSFLPCPAPPPTAFRAGIEGVVRVRVDVDAQGYPTDVSVEASSGNSDFALN